MKRLRLPCAALLCLVIHAVPASAAERYYMLIFGSQRFPNRANFSHTFAVFVRADADRCGQAGCPIETVTISWLPRTLKVQAWRTRPEPGRNFNLPATLDWACANGLRISMWGAFEIRRELYDLAVCRATFLQSGAMAYKAIDCSACPDSVADCIHATSGMDIGPGLLAGGTAYGDRASYLVLLHLSRWIIDPGHLHVWVSERLGLGRYPIVQRDWQGSRRLRYHSIP